MSNPRKTKRNALPKQPKLWDAASAWLRAFDRLDLFAAFSLSHLVFLRVWADHLIPLENAYFDYTRHSASHANVAGLWFAAASSRSWR